MIGRIDRPGALFMREGRGKATDEAAGITYELNCHMGGNPCVRSSKTGKWFTLSWQDVLTLARDAGIDDEPEAA